MYLNSELPETLLIRTEEPQTNLWYENTILNIKIWAQSVAYNC